jgi:hypothetical protein
MNLARNIWKSWLASARLDGKDPLRAVENPTPAGWLHVVSELAICDPSWFLSRIVLKEQEIGEVGPAVWVLDSYVALSKLARANLFEQANQRAGTGSAISLLAGTTPD